MPQCVAITKSGTRCVCKARPESDVCGKHVAQAGPAPVLTQCTHVTGGKRCDRIAHGGECDHHRKLALKREAHVLAMGVWAVLRARIWNPDRPLPDLVELYGMIATQMPPGPFAELYRNRLRQNAEIERHNAIMMRGPVRRAPAVNTELGRLAHDNQSVHTKVVTDHTNAAASRLLEAEATQTRTNLTLIREVCAKIDDKIVEKDVRKWYNTSECRTLDDYLYRKLLRGAWHLIQTSPHREDLEKRLVEECREGVGMCCEGHATRLCNVFVGFDDAFAPPVPVGELLQQKMSAIAAKDVSVEDKVGEAWAVFEELRVPMAERDAWIEAF
jgi:hypothetical protein